MAFDVAWNSAAGQSSGAQLSPNVPLTGQVSTATKQTCNGGPATSAILENRPRIRRIALPRDERLKKLPHSPRNATSATATAWPRLLGSPW